MSKYSNPLLLYTDTVLCPNLDDPYNGSVSVSSNFVGGSANYICNSGYRLSGYSYRTCLLSGVWSGAQPRCISKSIKRKINLFVSSAYLSLIHWVIGSCKYLSYPMYGYISVTTHDVGGRATYSCNSGFRLIGPSTRFCLSDGSWSGSEPICNCMWIVNYTIG